MLAAAAKVEATYITPIEHHNPMEPHATIARWDGDDKLTVWTATQGISGAQQTLSGLFNLPKENVTVICPYVGGGFGTKGNTWPPATLAAMAARKVGRPVKLEVTREQMFTSNGFRPRTIQRLRLGADADGKLVAVRHDGTDANVSPGNRRVFGSRGRREPDALRVPEHFDHASSGAGQSGVADLHARAGRGFGKLRPRIRRWTNWRSH